jgi:hypothetical protein
MCHGLECGRGWAAQFEEETGVALRIDMIQSRLEEEDPILEGSSSVKL